MTTTTTQNTTTINTMSSFLEGILTKDHRHLPSQSLPYITTAILTLLLLIISSRFQSYPKLPTHLPHLNPTRFYEPTKLRSKWKFVFGAREMLTAWFGANPGRPARVTADYGEVVVLPPEMADEIRADDRLSFSRWVYQAAHAHLPGFEGLREGTADAQIVQSVIGRDLTKRLHKITEPMMQETVLALSDIWTDDEEWHAVSLNKTLLALVARISSRVYLGDEGVRNEAWLRMTREYTVDVSIASEVLRLFPYYTRYLVHWVLPWCRRARAHVREARRILIPLLEQRRRDEHELSRNQNHDHNQKSQTNKNRNGKRDDDDGDDNDDEQPRHKKNHNDAISWLERAADGKPYDHVSAQLLLSIASIHTTTDLVSQAMIDLAGNPSILPHLREEIEVSLPSASNPNPTSAAHKQNKSFLSNLPLLDSALKETQRLKPISIGSMRRLALQDLTLSDGTFIPKGAFIAVSAHRNWDPSLHENPEVWDGYRYFNYMSRDDEDDTTATNAEKGTSREEKGGRENNNNNKKEKNGQYKLVGLSPDHLGFGYGKHACPGRFFAAAEIKIVLAEILRRYEWRLVGDKVPKPMPWGFNVVANPSVVIEVRRRRP